MFVKNQVAHPRTAFVEVLERAYLQILSINSTRLTSAWILLHSARVAFQKPKTCSLIPVVKFRFRKQQEVMP